MARHIGTSNLIPFSQRTKAEAREMGRLGGKASVESRRAHKTMAEIVKKMLDAELKRGTELQKQVRSQLSNLGNDTKAPTVEEAIVLANIKKALKGDTKASEFLRDTKGEKPTEVVRNEVEAPPIVIGALAPEWVESERVKQAAMRAEHERMDDQASNEPHEPPQNAPQIVSPPVAANHPANTPPRPAPVFYAPHR